MDFLSSLNCDSGPYCFVIVAVLVFGALYIYDTYLNNYCPEFSFDHNLTIFGYENHNGPAIWPQRYASAGGCRQSPLNLKERCAIVVPTETVPLLVFSNEFHTPPCEMKLYNSGYNVVVYATWGGCKIPKLSGGPLCEDYSFYNIRFRWGPNDNEGSEHMVNCTRYAMELQAFFMKSSSQYDDILQAARCGALLVLSYIFMVTPDDNPYLEPIVNALQYIKNPTCCISIEPIILSLLTPDFSRDYFTYEGSLTFPPCTEGVTWIVKPEPLLISSKQVRKFRKLKGCTRLIANNTRPVQKINNRDIFYYD